MTIAFGSFQAQNRAQLSLFMATLLWGVSPIFLDVIIEYLTPLHAITLRFGFAVLVLSFLLFLTKRREGFSLVSSKTLVLLGWVDAFGYLAATQGQKMTSPGIATLIASSYVFLVPFLVWKLEGKKPQMKMAFLAMVALSGVFLISFNGNWSNFSSMSIFGILILIGAASLFSVYTSISGKLLDISTKEGQQVDQVSFMYASLLHTLVPLAILSIITTKASFSLHPPEVIPLILFLAIFPTIVAFAMYNWSLSRLGSVRTSFYSLVQVIIPFAIEFVVLQQVYSGWVYAGIGVLLISLLML